MTMIEIYAELKSVVSVALVLDELGGKVANVLSVSVPSAIFLSRLEEGEDEWLKTIIEEGIWFFLSIYNCVRS